MKPSIKDVTDSFDFDLDGEFLAISKCVCGQEFDYWDFIINIKKNFPRFCPKCGGKFYFKQIIKIYEVEDK